MTATRWAVLAATGALLWACAPAEPPRTALFDPWINGAGADEPAMQVQYLDPDTVAIRQSFASSIQAPFLYLLFGDERALLIDTGDIGGAPVRETVDGVIDAWLADHGRDGIPLVVAHSHSHSDHHVGDAQFADRPDTVVVGLTPERVAAFFGVASWPDDVATFDLGGRPLDVIPTPGHEDAQLAIYDRRTKMLFSGDFVLPGAVLIPLDEFETALSSIDRLAAFAETHNIASVLGGHIEMDAAGAAFSFGATSHPNEHPLELDPAAIFELQAALHAMANDPQLQPHAEFVIVPVPPGFLAPFEYHE